MLIIVVQDSWLRSLQSEEGEQAVRARDSEHELLDMGDKSPFFI